MVIFTENSLFNNCTGLNKVRTEWKCLKTIIIQAQIRLYGVENKRTYMYTIIRNLRVVKYRIQGENNQYLDEASIESRLYT